MSGANKIVTLTLKFTAYNNTQTETVSIANMPASALLVSTESIAVSPATFLISVEGVATAQTGMKVSATGPSMVVSTTGPGLRVP